MKSRSEGLLVDDEELERRKVEESGSTLDRFLLTQRLLIVKGGDLKENL